MLENGALFAVADFSPPRHARTADPSSSQVADRRNTTPVSKTRKRS
jgi:hypothetical protein